MFAPWVMPAICGCLCTYGVLIVVGAYTSPKSRAYRAAKTRRTTNHQTSRGN